MLWKPCRAVSQFYSFSFLRAREIFIRFLRSGAYRINWIHAIQAPLATLKQQAVKALANIKEFMNEMSAPGRPPPPFDGTKKLLHAIRLTDLIICSNIWSNWSCIWGALHSVCHPSTQIQGEMACIRMYLHVFACIGMYWVCISSY